MVDEVDVEGNAVGWVGGVRENMEAEGKEFLYEVVIILAPGFGKQFCESLPPASYS